MENNDEQFFILEKEYQESLECQKHFFEAEIALLKSKFEFEKEKIRIELENIRLKQVRELEDSFNVKNVEDKDKIKKYYEKELQSTKQWYEEEIKKRTKETSDWHEKNLKDQITELKKSYEEKLKIQEDKFNRMEETLSFYIKEQKEYYEAKLQPFTTLMELRKCFNIDKSTEKAYVKKVDRLEEYEKSKEVKDIEINVVEDVQRPKVSVILPVYNVGRYLRQSLDSLINQTLEDIEIICVDDGSTDDSYDILEEYKEKDSRIIVIHKENKGTGAARNDGLRIASGECIGFVDPDDWVKPNMFERLYGLIKEKKLDIAMCMPDGYDEKNGITAPFPYFVDANFEKIIDDRVFNWKDLSPFSYPMCVWNKLYTKELFDKHNIDFTEGLDFEDHKVIFGSLFTAERMFFIREKLYVYRFNREGSILSDNNRRLIDHMEIFNIVENLMKETGTYKSLRYDFLEYKIHNLLYYYSMIRPEFKPEYYDNMVKSINETSLTKEEIDKLSVKYPELKAIIKITA